MSLAVSVPGVRSVIFRNYTVYRRVWLVFVSAFLEPLLFLLSIGIGVGGLVGQLPGPAGDLVDYRDFVAPGLMAVAAMNGSILDTTINFFVKLKYMGTYDSMLSTPLTPYDVITGEITWSVIRGTIYAAAFLVTMVLLGLVHSPLAVLAVPAAALVCWAFAGAGVAGASYMRSYFDFDFVNAVLIPSFLFSGVFFPVSRYPDWLEWIVRCTPLYQGVALIRGLIFGVVDASALVHIAYLAAMGIIGLRIATKRMGRLLQP
jgi:lipooligosaccharide transport system permease protein